MIYKNRISATKAELETWLSEELAESITLCILNKIDKELFIPIALTFMLPLLFIASINYLWLPLEIIDINILQSTCGWFIITKDVFKRLSGKKPEIIPLKDLSKKENSLGEGHDIKSSVTNDNDLRSNLSLGDVLEQNKFSIISYTYVFIKF